MGKLEGSGVGPVVGPTGTMMGMGVGVGGEVGILAGEVVGASVVAEAVLSLGGEDFIVGVGDEKVNWAEAPIWEEEVLRMAMRESSMALVNAVVWRGHCRRGFIVSSWRSCLSALRR